MMLFILLLILNRTTFLLLLFSYLFTQWIFFISFLFESYTSNYLFSLESSFISYFSFSFLYLPIQNYLYSLPMFLFVHDPTHTTTTCLFMTNIVFIIIRHQCTLNYTTVSRSQTLSRKGPNLLYDPLFCSHFLSLSMHVTPSLIRCLFDSNMPISLTFDESPGCSFLFVFVIFVLQLLCLFLSEGSSFL